ncbi:MAG: hypothetical protein AMXMBFR13_38440 [Phycisphaerae bacterium]
MSANQPSGEEAQGMAEMLRHAANQARALLGNMDALVAQLSVCAHQYPVEPDGSQLTNLRGEIRPQSAMGRISDAFFSLDSDWHCLLANAAAAQLAGRELQQMRGQSLWRLFPHVAATRVQEELIRAVRLGQTGCVEFPGPAAGRWFEARAYPAAGGITLILADITDRKQAEDQLRDSEWRLRLALDAGRMGTWEWEVNSGRVTWSDGHYVLLGYEPGAVESGYAVWRQCVHPEDLQRQEQTLLEAIQCRKDYECEFRVVWPDGSVHWVEGRGRCLLGPDGRAERMYGVLQDIDAKKQAEQDLQHALHRLRLALEGGGMGVFDVDEASRLVTLDDTAAARLGLPPGVLSLTAEELVPRIHPDDLRDVTRRVEAALREGRPYAVELRVTCFDGQVRWLAALGRPLMGPGGAIAHTIGVCMDVTARKQAEERLTRLNNELSRSNAELEEFASLVAHDLRSPMVSLQGCATLLAEEMGDALSGEAAETLDYISESVNRLSAMIGSLLEYSRVGRGVIRPVPCDTGTVLDDVLDTLSAVCTAAGAEVSYAELPVVHADPSLLARVFQNLIENAIKYCRDEPPRVHVFARDEPEAYVLAVRDNGLGIARMHFERIFAAFHRLHRDEDRYPGLGMGLTTCKKIVEKHGGRIWVESVPGQGATFFFTIPKQH